MTEPTPSSEHTEPLNRPAAATEPEAPRTVYVPQPPSRLNKAAAWVLIAAGSVFIVAVIFGAGFVLGMNVGDGSGHHHRGHEMVLRPGGGMVPPGGFERGPGGHGPFGPGPMIDGPRQPGGPGAPATTAPPRP